MIMKSKRIYVDWRRQSLKRRTSGNGGTINCASCQLRLLSSEHSRRPADRTARYLSGIFINPDP